MDFHIHVFQTDAVPEVPIEAVGLFHDQNPAAHVSRKKRKHFPELLSSGDFRGFYVYEFLRNMEFVSLCVFAQEFQLRGDGIPLAFLVFTRNTRVNYRISHVFLFFCFTRDSFASSPCTFSISASTIRIVFSTSSSVKIIPRFHFKSAFCNFNCSKRLSRVIP